MPIARPPELMNLWSVGMGFPASLSSIGLWSNVSTWLGPPFIRRKITLFRLCGEMRGFWSQGVDGGFRGMADAVKELVLFQQ